MPPKAVKNMYETHPIEEEVEILIKQTLHWDILTSVYIAQISENYSEN